MISIIFYLALVGTPGTSGQETGGRILPGGPKSVTSHSNYLRAIRGGLAFLASRQSSELGCVGTRYEVAVTSLSGLAFLGAGQSYGRGEYGENVKLCVKYILHGGHSSTGVPGFLGREGSQHSMYGHCFAVLFLTQVYGELPRRVRERVGRAIKRGVSVIGAARSYRGGWYYNPVNEGHKDENSITVCALQALRAARNVGFAVDPGLIHGAKEYLAKCQKKDGSFRYSLSGKVRSSTFELTCGSVASLQALGGYGTEQVNLGLEYLKKRIAGTGGQPLAAATKYPFYGNFYAAQLFHAAGGEVWHNWEGNAYPRLLEEGKRLNWRWKSRFGDEYATSMAVLILEVPMGYLPIFEK